MAGEANFSFSPTMDGGVLPVSAGADLTGSAANQSVAIPEDATAVRVSVTTAEARIKFGVSSDTVTTTTGYRLQDGMTDVFRRPRGATHMHYIGNTASINYVWLA